MERVIKPDPLPLRKGEYEQMDGELLHGLVEFIELNADRLQKKGFVTPESLKSVLSARQGVKDLYRKKGEI